jgi:pimeloyl-ACP methyl ester carboxylesterase
VSRAAAYGFPKELSALVIAPAEDICLKMRKTHRWLLFIVGAVVLIGTIQTARHFFREEEREARIRMRQTIMEEFPDAVKEITAAYGLRPLATPSGPSASGASRSVVILVHGLDDPGKIWMNLAPALIRDDFAVWILTYPNDQPVVDSALFFLAELSASALARTDRVSIVAHSMGGLVTREMLTDPALDYAGKKESGGLPAVDRFIMVGTPNHGSELARLRAFTEFRDQLANLFKKDYHWLQGIVDGAGEAGIDLLPGSAFLQRLNSRPHPANVHMLVVAGVMSPKSKQEIKELAHRLEQRLPDPAQGSARKMSEGLIAMTEQIGDGLVSVESARLPGVPLKTVQGTHLSIIRNLSTESQRVPSAIPVIREAFGQASPE